MIFSLHVHLPFCIWYRLCSNGIRAFGITYQSLDWFHVLHHKAFMILQHDNIRNYQFFFYISCLFSNSCLIILQTVVNSFVASFSICWTDLFLPSHEQSWSSFLSKKKKNRAVTDLICTLNEIMWKNCMNDQYIRVCVSFVTSLTRLWTLKPQTLFVMYLKLMDFEILLKSTLLHPIIINFITYHSLLFILPIHSHHLSFWLQNWYSYIHI